MKAIVLASPENDGFNLWLKNDGLDLRSRNFFLSGKRSTNHYFSAS